MSLKKPIVIASGPVIIENGKVLLNKHGDDNFWKFVGGRVEDYDISLEEVAKREAKEEMGIEIKIMSPLKPMMVNLPDKVVILIHYLAERIGEIDPGKEIIEWGWFDTNNLPSDCAPNIKSVIESYYKTSGGK